ncbi:MAG: glycosyltransferase family 4 protein [Bacteroidota bacterium]
MDLKKSGRILYISSVDVSIGNGPGVNELEFILGLSGALGDRAHFLIPRPEAEVPGLPAGACSFTAPHRRHHPWFFLRHVLSEVREAGRILSAQKFDLIVFRLDLLPIGPFLITRRHGVPYALKTLGQGMINVLNEKLGLPGRLLGRINRALANRLLDGAILADSVSTAQVEYLHQVLEVRPADKIVWIDNAVNTGRFQPVSAAGSRQELGLERYNAIAGYVGTRPWERGGMQLVEAAPRLLEKFPGLGIVILGDGSELDALKKRAAELGVSEHCVFTGYVPFEKVPSYINSLDVGVSINLRPDRSAASELKVRQYLACGKPVVLSPGSNDFVALQEFGSIVPPADLEAITGALERWLSLGPDERERFCARATAYMRQNLSIEAAIERRLDLWSEKLPNLPYRTTG